MSLPETYARRKRRRAEEGKAKVLREHPFGAKLLTQLYHAFQQIDNQLPLGDRMTPSLVTFIREEMGVLALAQKRDIYDEFRTWWFEERSTFDEDDHDMRLTAVEAAFSLGLAHAKIVDNRERSFGKSRYSTVRDIINIANARMLEDGFGFQYKDGDIIELTSEFAYAEVISPALNLLSSPLFAAANAEFRDAFEEFKKRNYEDCIADCGNAFESVMKVIAARKGWSDVQPTDPASKLIEALYRHDLIPVWMQEQIKGLRAVLQGVATVRNKEASHGAGETPRDVSKELAAYQLHQTAAAIIFLASQAGLA